jgi:hypothetical protein
MSDMPVSELPTDVCRPHPPTVRGLGWRAVHWILTGMVVVASAATVVFTGYLMWRLFTLQPGAPDATALPETPGEPS